MAVQVKARQAKADFMYHIKKINSSVLSYSSSKHFIMEMLPLCVQNILYQRLNLNSDDFERKVVDGLEYVITKDNALHQSLLKSWNSWAEGVKDAINKEYLHELYLFIKNPTSGIVKEYYKFTLKRAAIDNNFKAKHAELTQDVCDLFKVIKELGTYEKCNDRVEIKMELTYYEEVTPKNYEPPFFQTPKEIPSIFAVSKQKSTLEKSVITGRIKTQFHSLPYEIGLLTDGCIINANRIADIRGLTNQEVTPRKPAINKKLKDEQVEIFSQSSSVICSPGNLKCTCRTEIILPCLSYITCSKCKMLFHSACQGILKDSFELQAFVCSKCRNVKCVTANLSLSRLLLACLYFTKNPQCDLLSVLDTNDDSIWTLLVSMGAIFMTDKKNADFTVNYDNIKNVLLPKYFKNVGKCEASTNISDEPLKKRLKKT